MHTCEIIFDVASAARHQGMMEAELFDAEAELKAATQQVIECRELVEIAVKATSEAIALLQEELPCNGEDDDDSAPRPDLKIVH